MDIQLFERAFKQKFSNITADFSESDDYHPARIGEVTDIAIMQASPKRILMSGKFRYLTMVKDANGKKKLEWLPYFDGILECRLSDKKFYRLENADVPSAYVSHQIEFNRHKYQNLVNDMFKFFEEYIGEQKSSDKG